MKNSDIEALVRPNIRSLCPYSTARDEYKGSLGVFLDANESPYQNGINRYPDPRQKVLKERISAIKGLPVENIFLGNGSDEAIDLLYRIFCIPGKDNAVIMAPSYGMYSVCAETNDVEVREVELGADFSLPADQLLAAADGNSKLMFLCSPNNPTGNAFSPDVLLNIVDSFKGIVVIDEAYADFSTLGSLRGKILERPNLVVLQTLSKAWGMAGLRLGMAFAQEYIIRLMSMVKYPYNINCLAQEAALKALESPVDGKIAEILSERGRLSEVISGFGFVEKLWPSDANFLLVKVDDASAVYGHLLVDGIIVRNRDKVRLCKGCLRITVGLKDENEKLIKSLNDYEKGDIRR